MFRGALVSGSRMAENAAALCNSISISTFRGSVYCPLIRVWLFLIHPARVFHEKPKRHLASVWFDNLCAWFAGAGVLSPAAHKESVSTGKSGAGDRSGRVRQSIQDSG